ncbi:inositol polyphosphate multikinase [Glossina fuscipes]|uniref:Kinase n=2 Tax=Nemorhina TaxID=44051 RepID=A0A1B0BPE6_9MUSC|nr:inositol polyphosphate multikinase [Glossina fuscipes]
MENTVMNSELLLPKGFCLLETQVAGHTFSSDAKALGMLKNEILGCVLKPMGKPECGERELAFYECVTDSNDPILNKVRSLIPKFYEKIKLRVNTMDHTFLKLEDLTHCIKKPCIMDIKIGKRTWDPLATAEKRDIEEKKYVQCKQKLGLCLPGFQVYSKTPLTQEEVLLRYGKDYGRQLNDSEFRKTMSLFLQCQKVVCWPLVQELLTQLYAIRDWFSEQRLFHFYASSLLVVYDYETVQFLTGTTQNGSKETLPNGNAQNDVCDFKYEDLAPTALSSARHVQNVSPYIKVRMIDFAHVFPASDGSPDTNYIFGLQNLIKIIEDLLSR